MGLECHAVCHWQGRSSSGQAYLEGDHIAFRGEFRMKLMLVDIRGVVATRGRLSLTAAGGTAALDIGDKAEAWAERIRNPKGLIDKLGMRPGDCVALIGAEPDPVLLAELAGAGIDARRTDSLGPDETWIILSAAGPADLSLAGPAAAALAPKGVLWVVYPKGRSSPVPQDAVLEAGRGTGLADVKVCAVSAAATALKFMRRKG